MFVRLLETGEVHSDGGIPLGTPDRISGGVFVLPGAEIGEVRNLGAVTTYGANDMVLDIWERVERWRAHAKVTSHGPSGIGFVDFGELGNWPSRRRSRRTVSARAASTSARAPFGTPYSSGSCGRVRRHARSRSRAA